MPVSRHVLQGTARCECCIYAVLFGSTKAPQMRYECRFYAPTESDRVAIVQGDFWCRGFKHRDWPFDEGGNVVEERTDAS